MSGQMVWTPSRKGKGDPGGGNGKSKGPEAGSAGSRYVQSTRFLVLASSLSRLAGRLSLAACRPS